MVERLAPGRRGAGVEVGVHVDHGQGPVDPGCRAHRRERDRVVTADEERGGAGPVDGEAVGLDPLAHQPPRWKGGKTTLPPSTAPDRSKTSSRWTGCHPCTKALTRRTWNGAKRAPGVAVVPPSYGTPSRTAPVAVRQHAWAQRGGQSEEGGLAVGQVLERRLLAHAASSSIATCVARRLGQVDGRGVPVGPHRLPEPESHARPAARRQPEVVGHEGGVAGPGQVGRRVADRHRDHRHAEPERQAEEPLLEGRHAAAVGGGPLREVEEGDLVAQRLPPPRGARASPELRLPRS